MRYQGNRFVERFDANSYLYITKALDYFDLANGHHSLIEALERETGLEGDLLTLKGWKFGKKGTKLQRQ